MSASHSNADIDERWFISYEDSLYLASQTIDSWSFVFETIRMSMESMPESLSFHRQSFLFLKR